MNNTKINHATPQRDLWSPEQNEDQIILQAVRILESRLIGGDAMSSPESVMRYCQCQISPERDEVFCALFLTSQHHLICFERLFTGTIDGASVYPRVVVRRALELNAAAVIFSHNHPSGIAEPSNADEQITKKLVQSLALIDVRVLDHIVVGTASCVSFAERGLL